MRTVLCAWFVLCVAAAAMGQSASASQPAVQRLSQSADQELINANKELTDLRARIADEKAPLDRELNQREEELKQLRARQADLQRQVDMGLIENAHIRAVTKARQDELAYVGNLLDEYVKTFETKIHVSELQYCGEAIESAKQAATNNALSLREKFDRQLNLVQVSIDRLSKVVGGMRFKGVGVSPHGDVVHGEYALIGPVALFSASGASGVVIPQAGSTRPLIRPIEGDVQNGIAPLVASGQGEMPLDPSRGAALKALVQKTSLIHLFKKGGPIMWPLLAASILSLATVLERLFFLFVENLRRNRKALDSFFSAIGKGHAEEAIASSAKSKYYVVRAMRYALMHKEESLESALLYAQSKELKRFQRGIPVLDTVITLAPLLGLLGTITGMMGSFSVVGGDLSSPTAVTGGVAEALIATAFGLGIAITSLLPFNFLNAKVEEARHEMESASSQLELLVVRPTGSEENHAHSNGGAAAPAMAGS